MVDASHEKEARAKETIAQLKTEISNLSRLVEQGAGLSVGQENTVNELLHEKEELAAERDQQLAQISDLRSDTAVYLAKLRAKETERLSASQDIQSLKDSISSKKAEQEREERRRERLDKEAKDLRTVLELRAAELKARNVQLSSANEKGDKLEDALRVQNFSTEKALLELETMKERMVKAEGGLKDQLSANEEKVAENVIRQAELRKTDQEIAKVRQVTQSSSKQKETQQKRLNMLDQERAELNRDHETLKTQAASLEREIDIEKRETATAKKQATELQQELEDLRKALEKAADSTQRQVCLCDYDGFCYWCHKLYPTCAPKTYIRIAGCNLQAEFINDKDARSRCWELQAGICETSQNSLPVGEGAGEIWLGGIQRKRQIRCRFGRGPSCACNFYVSF